LLRTQLAKESNAVDIAEVFKDIVKAANLSHDSLGTDESLSESYDDENIHNLQD
jgi:hypothetical protein